MGWGPSSWQPCMFRRGPWLLSGLETGTSRGSCGHKTGTPVASREMNRLCSYLVRESKQVHISLKERFLLLRDRAMFSIQFFAGEWGLDLTKLSGQEIYKMKDNNGLIFRQTFGKTRTEKMFAVRRCAQSDVCAVQSLENYSSFAKTCDIDLSSGYIFRKLNPKGNVVALHLSQAALNRRQETHLKSIGLYDNETSHSLRGDVLSP